MLKKHSKNEILIEYDDVLDSYKSKHHGNLALSKYSHWFPVKSNPSLAGIVADLMGDGHLQGSPKLRIDYTSKYVQELERFNSEICKLFKINGKIRDCTSNDYGTKTIGINNKPLARVLNLIGVPIGAKVFVKFNIPKWIIEDKSNFSRFVNRLYCCEANVDTYSKCIELKMYKSEFLINEGLEFFNEIRTYLEKYFSIKTLNPFLTKPLVRKDGRKTIGIRLKIKDKTSLKIFYEQIRFDDETKMLKLEKIIR